MGRKSHFPLWLPAAPFLDTWLHCRFCSRIPSQSRKKQDQNQAGTVVPGQARARPLNERPLCSFQTKALNADQVIFNRCPLDKTKPTYYKDATLRFGSSLHPLMAGSQLLSFKVNIIQTDTE